MISLSFMILRSGRFWERIEVLGDDIFCENVAVFLSFALKCRFSNNCIDIADSFSLDESLLGRQSRRTDLIRTVKSGGCEGRL
jgi:hypothetical protein